MLSSFFCCNTCCTFIQEFRLKQRTDVPIYNNLNVCLNIGYIPGYVEFSFLMMPLIGESLDFSFYF